MSFRLDQELTNLLENSEGDYDNVAETVGADSDDMYDLLCCWHNEKGSIQINGHTFNYVRTVKKNIDDYHEGKCEYHYDIQVIDRDTSDAYDIVCACYNDEFVGFEIEYTGVKNVPAEDPYFGF